MQQCRRCFNCFPQPAERDAASAGDASALPLTASQLEKKPVVTGADEAKAGPADPLLSSPTSEGEEPGSTLGTSPKLESRAASQVEREAQQATKIIEEPQNPVPQPAHASPVAPGVAEAAEGSTVSGNNLNVSAGADNKLVLFTGKAPEPAAPEPTAAPEAAVGRVSFQPQADGPATSTKRSSLQLRQAKQCSLVRSSDGEGLGLAMVLIGDGVRISALKPTGAVAVWNATQRPRKQLLAGATVIEVNGISGNASAIRDELKRGDKWDITFRPPPVEVGQGGNSTDDEVEPLDDAMTNSLHEAMSMASSFRSTNAVQEELARVEAEEQH